MNGSRPTDAERDIVELLAVATLAPSDDFRTTLRAELVGRRPHDVAVVHSVADRRRRAWPIAVAAAAAAVVLVVAAAVVLRSPGDDLDPASLADDSLFEELSGRRWIALERFDDPTPTALTPTVTFTGSVAAPEIMAHDGCTAYGGTVSFDGRTIVGDDFAAPDSDCGVDVLAIEPGQQVEMRPDDTAFTLLDADGNPVATFVDDDTLEPATADVMPFTWFVDDLETVEFTETGRGVAMFCTTLSWEERDGRILVTLPDPDVLGCSGFENEDGVVELSPVATELRELTADGAEVLRTADGLLLVGDRGAIHLRSLPTADVDPNGVTIAAGALFGIRPDVGISPDEVIDAVTPTLGAPDRDTGWIDRRSLDTEGPVQDCGLSNYREIAWGDLVTGFWGAGSRTVLLIWYVGDRRTVGAITPVVNRPDSPVASNLTTEHGVTVGDPVESIPDRFNITTSEPGSFGDTRFEPDERDVRIAVLTANPDATRANLVPAILGGSYLAVDGTIVGFGAEGAC